ncbi:unnamed protein product [Oikopleura dioica]|uniref:Uncharacterized protein n=1 Tax=Oikopleura dioica TaxID=34765 RepID=E4X4K1_OIKDI|nr:unnamed protein product [Oikopleura dioica]
MPRLGPADFPCPEPTGLVQDADDYKRQFEIKNLFAEKDIIREVRNDKKALMSAGIAQSAEEIKEELMREIPPPAKHQYVQEIRDSVNQCKSLVDDFLFRVMQEDKTVRTQTPILPFLINSTEMRKKRLEIQERAKENAAAAANVYTLAKDNDINNYDYEKYLEELEFPPTIKIQKIINRVLNTKTTLQRLRKAPPNIMNSKELQNLANSFLWWIYEREFGQCRRNILNKIYNKMAYSFVSLLNIQAGKARDDILDHLPTIVAQIVWLALWHQFTDDWASLARPVFLSALVHDCFMQISGTPPEIACWRHWPFIELIENEDEPIPVEIQTLLATSPQIIQHNLRKFTPKSTNLDEHEIAEKPKTKAERIQETQVVPSVSDLSLQVGEDESTVVSKSVDLTSEATPNLMKFVTNSFDIGTHSPLYRYLVETRKTFQRKAKRIELGIIPDIRGFTSKLDLADQVVEHVKMQKTRGNEQIKADRKLDVRDVDLMRQEIATLTKRIENAKRIKDKELLNRTLKEANAFLHEQKAAELLREHQNKMPLPYENQ